MHNDFSAIEIRVIGVLLEKAVTTPDQYPMTLNAVMIGCNQKTSRDPVMELSSGEVLRTLRQLEDRYLVSVTPGARAGVEKFVQRICNTPMAELKLDEAGYAVVTLLLLRGPQTPGELRSRSGRLHGFEDNAAVVETLKGLIEREEGSLVARLPRKQGRQDSEYMHLFAGEIESAPEEAPVYTSSRSPRPDRVGELEARVTRLEQALQTLAGRLGEVVDLADDPDGERDSREEVPADH